MLKRELSTNKLPKIPPADSTLSSKLYSLTGLRIFQAKFMDELRYPRPKPSTLIGNSPSQNAPAIMQGKTVSGGQGFTGKDRGNESRVEGAANGQSRVRQNKEGLIKLKQTEKAEKVRVLCGRPKGLRNLGNTCYLNAILQSLLALQEFNCALERELRLRKLEKGLTASYSRVLTAYRNCSERDVITPSEFKAQMGKRKDRFAGSAQQDAQQFLTAFLQGINEEMTRVKVKPKYKELPGDPTKDSIKNIANEWWTYNKQRDDSVVCDYFQGQTECSILCSQCKFRAVSFDNFWGLPLSLGTKGSSLQDLLSGSFSTQHRLEDYSCQKCKKAKTCSKRIRVFRPPAVLVVQLKRFGYGWSRKQKIKDRVAVPLSLSLKEVMSSDAGEEETAYRLKSTVEHSGELNFGHYTGHAYSQKDEKWFEADDEKIAEQGVSKDAPELYLLFYARK